MLAYEIAEQAYISCMDRKLKGSYRIHTSYGHTIASVDVLEGYSNTGYNLTK